MKNIIAVLLLSFLTINTYAQEQEMQPANDKEIQPREESRNREESAKTGGFKLDHLFTGGGIDLSFSSYNFLVGASPVIGYSINKWVDVGIGLNFSYASQKEYIDYGYDVVATGNKYRQTDIAPLAFARFYPLKFLFIQAQGEQHIISQKYISAAPTIKGRFDATSLLLGAGYASGRQDVGDFFYYVSLSVDVLKNKNSPYVQRAQNGDVNILPILKAGIQVPLFQGKKRY